MFLALKEFKHAKLRYALVTGVIVMVASLVFILSGLANGLASGNSEAIDAIEADAFVVGSGSEFLMDRSRLSPEVISAVQEADGIDEAQPFAAFAGNVRIAEAEGVVGVSIVAVPADTFLDPSTTSGDRLADAPDGVVIDQSMANEGVGIGDMLVFDPTGVEMEVVGIVDGYQYRLAPTVMINIDKLAEINPESDGTVGAIAVRGDVAAIEALPDEIDGIVVGSSSDLIQGLPGYQEQRGTLLLIQVFLVVIAAGIIAAFFFILTLQKMSELGVMKAIGATTFVLARALVIQALSLSIIGILIGISAGCTMLFVAEGRVPYRVQWEQMVLYGSMLLIVAVGGTLLSLVRIARVDPLDAINSVN